MRRAAPLTFTIGTATPSVMASDAGGPYTGNPFRPRPRQPGSAADGQRQFCVHLLRRQQRQRAGSINAADRRGTYTVVAAFTSSELQLRQCVELPADVHDRHGHAERGGQRCGRPLHRQSLPATATATGIGSATVSGSFALHVLRRQQRQRHGIDNAADRCGTYTVVAAFTSSNSNYGNASSLPADVHHRHGHAQRRGERCGRPVQRQSLSGLGHGDRHWRCSVSGSFIYTYYVGSSASGPSSSTPPTSASTYTVVAAFTSSNSNYGNASSLPLTFTIGTATPTVTASDAGGPYTGNPYPATATATGIGGAAVSGTFVFTYYTGGSASGQGSTTPPTGPGQFTVVAAFTSTNPNYGNASSLPVTFTISSSGTTSTPTIVVSDPGGTYNGKPFPATATAKGTGGVTISGTFTFTYYVGQPQRAPDRRPPRPTPTRIRSWPVSPAPIRITEMPRAHR